MNDDEAGHPTEVHLPEVESIRILLVEDSPSSALIVQTALQAQGFERVDIVESGEAAVEAASAARPDLVFMDIALAGDMDGVEAARDIRRVDHIPVIFLTGSGDPETIRRAREAEPYGYLLKPVDPRDLRPTIEMALHKHRMEEERRELTERLQAALAEVEKLRGLLPLCAWCRKVRDDQGYWETLEQYVARHLDTRYTHGICPNCLDRFDSGAKDRRD